jgi:hypothetical protein
MGEQGWNRRLTVSDPIQEAKARRAKLQAEIELIDQYLALHRQIFGDVGEATVVQDHVEAEVIPAANRQKVRPLNDPVAIANEMEAILSEADNPLTRGQLRRALADRGVTVNSKDVGKYLGTLLWRNQSRFINVEGEGYWLRSRPLPDRLVEKDLLLQ